MKKKVVLLGSISLARNILDLLYKNNEVEVLGVVTEPGYKSEEETVFDYASKNNIPLLSLDICKQLEPDLGFSIRFHKIIKKSVIDSFNDGIINLHGGPLPYYRGSCCNIFAILNEEKEFGVTLHYIDEGIDTGDVIDVKYFPIIEDETGYSLFQKMLNKGFELFKENINDILKNNNSRIKQEKMSKDRLTGLYYTKTSDLENYKKIDFTDMSKDEIYKRVKAFHFPDKESVYYNYNNKKIYLNL